VPEAAPTRALTVFVALARPPDSRCRVPGTAVLVVSEPPFPSATSLEIHCYAPGSGSSFSVQLSWRSSTPARGSPRARAWLVSVGGGFCLARQWDGELSLGGR
jgi:hypothetical protein